MMTVGGLNYEKFRSGGSSSVYKYDSHCTYFSEELVNDFIKHKIIEKTNKEGVKFKLFCKLFIDVLNKSHFRVPAFSPVKCIAKC